MILSCQVPGIMKTSIDVLQDICSKHNIEPTFDTVAYTVKKSSNGYLGRYVHSLGLQKLSIIKDLVSTDNFAINTQTSKGFIPVIDIDSNDFNLETLFDITGAKTAYVMQSSLGKTHVYFDVLLPSKINYFMALKEAKEGDQVWVDMALENHPSGGYIRVAGVRGSPTLTGVWNVQS